MRKRFTKEEDRAILDAYVRNGFHLTAQAMEEVSKETGRTLDAIRNRMSRYLFPQYPMTLNRDVHIRIFLIDNLTKAHNSSNPDAYTNVLIRASKIFKIETRKFISNFETNPDIIWGKEELKNHYEVLPDTMEQLVQYIIKEDEKYHLFDDLVMEFCTKKDEPKVNWFKRLINWIKSLFK